MYADLMIVTSEIDYRRDRPRSSVVRAPEHHRRQPWSRRAAKAARAARSLGGDPS